jgi:hypothetical protein
MSFRRTLKKIIAFLKFIFNKLSRVNCHVLTKEKKRKKSPTSRHVRGTRNHPPVNFLRSVKLFPFHLPFARSPRLTESMKCRSVACIWSGTPPSHRVTATAVLNQPPTLYTGGSDGSIVWWSLFSADPNPVLQLASVQFSFSHCLRSPVVC